MIVTPTCERNLNNLKVAVNSSRAVLIQGEVGCGKSFFAHALAEECGAKATMIQVNVDDSFDSKDLLGKFSATDVPGSFEWIPGPLTSAVENGYWILMEDIDLASFDVFSVLLSLLEESTLFLPDKNRRIDAHSNFKLLATQQLRPIGDALTTRKSSSVPFLELWGTVLMINLPVDEICTIVTSLYSIQPSIVLNLATIMSPRDNTRLITLRRLLKWCERVSKRLPCQRAPDGFLSSTVRELMFREAFDCVLAGYPDGKDLDYAMGSLASALELQLNAAEALIKENKPIQTLTKDYYTIGRVTLPLFSGVSFQRESRIAFAATKHAMSLLERLAVAVDTRENVLLTGETGVGKTFIVQYLADQLGQKLIVHNLNQQTDSSDFMGGWKPVDVGVSVRGAYQTFVELFSQTFNAERNVQFLDTLQAAVQKSAWSAVVKQVLKGCHTFKLKKERQAFPEELELQWVALEYEANGLLETLEKTKTTFAFHFEEGSLAKAWREGSWILLDELNLASTEILERVSSVLGDDDSLFLTDKDNSEPIKRHKNFHVFANMNPPTDVGKKDLPPSLRSKFTEFYVGEPFDRNDINTIVNEYIGHLSPDSKTEEITTFFLECVGTAKSTLCSLSGETKPPSFSLRTLTRALSYVRKATSQYGFLLALFDGLMLGFASTLQRQFHTMVEQLIIKNVFHGKQPPRPTLPRSPSGANHVAYEHIWLPIGSTIPTRDESFILTPSVRGHLLNVARAVFAERPVLLEGPTSSGKSSMVKYLAELTGHKFVRINNHESTEIQEYVGHYVSDERGKLRFVDGILVDAVRKGYWVVLDELNLAPTDVLEALNRLLDDNRELYIPDTQEIVKPHPHLRIFATQNPAGVYGGRKMLSRAFRNRFLEITVDDIPTHELCTILCQRYSLNSSFAEKMVEIMVSLQQRRQASQVFAGRHGFITPRDLFRWAERKPSTYQEMAEHGFLLLAERCRKSEERQIVKDVIESVTKVELNENEVYSPERWPYVALYYNLLGSGIIDEFNIVWTESMRRLFTVVGICLHHKEPVLLVGETGSSKTTVCEIWARLLKQSLRIVNCHQHTEAADFLGSLRPVPPDQRSGVLFEWRNGPLVECMLHGSVFVLDEISLSEDSVLERLNSVLEPSRCVTLAEKSSADVIVAHEDFRILATMNPGGDFGKKELSPALRNRFTEIYVRPTTNEEEITLILAKRLIPRLEPWAQRMASLLCHASKAITISGMTQHISIRDIIGWVSFMNAANEHCDDGVAFMHGLDSVILDGIGVGTGQVDFRTRELRETCLCMAKEASGVDESCLQIPFWNLFDTMSEPKLPPEMEQKFFFGAPSTCRNLSKLARASIMRKAILLEGSPGVGKTSIVEALGCALEKLVVRINLSEQTDIMDLFGTYLPCPTTDEANGPQFAWSDGVLLQALKNGWWVILDELNLASQAVLEGLNALLDHRTSVFIPELGEEFHAAENFRVFACQNPLMEGGGRKGLPRSFLNRFTKVRIDPFEIPDLMCIVRAVYPNFDPIILEKMVLFVSELHRDVMVRRAYGMRGSPWEFNLRDILRWAKLMEVYETQDKPTKYVEMLFTLRMRTDADRQEVHALIDRVFENTQGEKYKVDTDGQADFLIVENAVYFGHQFLAQRRQYPVASSAVKSLLLPLQVPQLRSLLICAEQNLFCLLVGPSGAGKTFSIRTAAELVGARVVTFSMNASCDTVDLLGGFDQVEGKQGQFEWRDSVILEAILAGDWLVLDNVNYCNACVLDRLNPLVEPNGVLSVNEQGLVDGQVRVVRPHPNFRLFATLDPKYGEISRAMRNRAVEIYISPIPIPSLESVAVTGAASPGADTKLHFMLSQYHREFLLGGFHADTAATMSPQLSDALAVGAPNFFTLLKTSSMLNNDGSGTTEDLRVAILHKYIHNRSGQWVINKASVLEVLEAVLSTTNKPNKELHPSLEDLVDATRLHDEQGIACALVRIRVLRSGLALSTAARTGRGMLGNISPQSLVLYFVLDQHADMITSTLSLANARREFLSTILVSLLDEDDISLALDLIAPYGSLEMLWCRAFFALGPHAATLRYIQRTSRILISESPPLNTAFHHVLVALHDLAILINSPKLMQNFCRYSVPLVEILSGDFQVGVENFVPLVTILALFQSIGKKQSLLDATVFLTAVDKFLAALRRYLDLPYPLVVSSQRRKHRVRPHITTPDERAALVAWSKATTTTAASSTPYDRLVRSLWHTAAFRAEFALVMTLQRVCRGQSVSALRSLLSDVRHFIELYCTQLHVVSEIEVALWTELLSITPKEGSFETAIAAILPVLTTRFLVRHRLNSGECILNGSWSNAAHETLGYAAAVSIASIGSAMDPHTKSLVTLSNFCCVLPLASVNPFEVWEQNAMAELLDGFETSPNERSCSLLQESALNVARQRFASKDPILDTQHNAFAMVVADGDYGCMGSLRRVAIAGAIRCRMMLPESPIDPMYKWAVKKRVATEELESLSRQSESFLWAATLAMRNEDGAPCRLLRELQEDEKVMLNKATHKSVARPDPSGAKFAQLVGVLHHTTGTLLADERLEVVMSNSGPDATTAQRTWAELLFQQMSDILESYGGYEDVTLAVAEPALFAALAAHVGSILSTPKLTQWNGLLDVSEMTRMMQYPFLAVTSPTLPVARNDVLQQRLAYLDSCLTLVQSTPARFLRREFVEGLFAQYREFYRTVEELEERERREKEMNVLYAEKALVIEGDDERHLRALKELFPSYEEEFILTRDGDDNDTIDDVNERDTKHDKTEVKKEGRAGRHTRLLLTGPHGARYVRHLLDAHYTFFSRILALEDRTIFDGDRALQAFKCRFDVLSEEMNRARRKGAQWNELTPADEQLLLGGYAVRAALLRQELSHTETSLEAMRAAGFNIFMDPAPSELRTFSLVLQRLSRAVDNLIGLYPETPSLQRCARIASRIAGLPALTTPLMKVMTGCEVLLRECYEWERNASRETSILAQMTELSSFVLRWRRLELHCWSQVFTAKQEEFELRAGMQWFRVYDLINGGEPIPLELLADRCAEFFRYCMEYMWSANYGDFHVRLRILKAYGMHLLATSDPNSPSPLANAAMHVVDFFSQFSNLISTKLRETLLPLEEDMSAFVRIMRWEDATYYAVRATAEKSHLKMGRALAELEDILRTPIISTVSAEEKQCEDVPDMGFQMSVANKEDRTREKKSAKKLSNPSSNGKTTTVGETTVQGRTKRRRSGRQTTVEPSYPNDATGSREEKFLSAWGNSNLSHGIVFLRESADEIVARVQALQAPKVPQSHKIRALKTLFTVLAENGVPHTHETQVPPWEELFASTGPLLACCTVHGHHAAIAQVTRASTELYRYARWLQRMRDVERQPHKDLSAAQVSRGTGTAEGLFALTVEQAGLTERLFKLRQDILLLRDGAAACEVYVVCDAEDIIHGMGDACVQLQCLIHNTRWMQQERIIDDASVGPLLVELGTGAEELWRLCLSCEGPRRAMTPVADALLEQGVALLLRLQGVCCRLRAAGARCVDAAAAKTAAALGSAAAAVVAATSAHTHAHAVTTCAHNSVEGQYKDDGGGDGEMKRPRLEAGAKALWECEVFALLDKLDAVWVDDAITTPTTDDKEQQDTQVYGRYETAIRTLVVNVETVAPLVHDVLHKTIKERRMSATTRSEIVTRLGLALERVDAILNSTLEALEAQSHMGLVLSRLLCVLLKKGFCKSEDDDDDDDDKDKEDDKGDGAPQDGTGMDDGKGMKDVTDEIENEDQLMNMKDKKEQNDNDDKDDEGDGEDNAADVETDFQGQKERREESDDGNDDDENDDDDSQKEMGSVDGDDDNRERKKMRRDHNDNDQDMLSEEDDEHGADGAEEVPEDEMASNPEETGNFENREEAIRNAEEKNRDKENDHELVADADGKMEDDEADNNSEDSGDSASTSGSDARSDDGDENSPQDREGSLNEKDRDAASNADEKRDDGDHTDSEQDAAERSDDNNDNNSDDNDNDDNDAASNASDAPDENIRHGGRQDEHAGEEATERDKATDAEQRKKKKSHQDNNKEEEEEQQPGEEQKPDDAGQSFRPQQSRDPTARSDAAQEQKAAARNPYRAIKEALQRHDRRVQQLNLNRHVHVKKQRRDEGAENRADREKKKRRNEDEEEEEDEAPVDEFEFDEDGEREGMAATDDRPPPTAAESTLPEKDRCAEKGPEGTDTEEEEKENEEEEDDDEEGLQQRRRRRLRQQREDTTIHEEEGDENEEDEAKGPTGRHRVKASTRHGASPSEDGTSDESSAGENEADANDEDERTTRGRQLWQEQFAAVQGLSHHLCEQLRLILAPTLADKLQGDYKSGKRLNMKRIIPYIASQFKKDRIWLRRTKPNKRAYQVLVALDDSLSMQSNNAGVMSCRAVVLLAEALRQLEVGELGLACFGRETRIVHEMGEPFTSESGPRAFSEVTFAQTSTSMRLLLETSLTYLDDARERMHGRTRSTTQELQQMLFIISDGQITEDRAELRRLLMRAAEKRQIVVLVLLDVKTAGDKVDGANNGAKPTPAALSASDLAGLSVAERMRRLKAEREARLHRVQSNSILDMQVIEFNGGRVVRRPYMEDFPFTYYLIVRELDTLPGAIADAMRQWFEMLNLQN